MKRWKAGAVKPVKQRFEAVGNSGPGLWQKLSNEGRRPAMVPAGRVADAAYLEQRGITRVVAKP